MRPFANLSTLLASMIAADWEKVLVRLNMGKASSVGEKRTIIMIQFIAFLRKLHIETHQ